MIGRGTRLCPDVFGPGKDKEYFLIFDVCQNFEFFEINKTGIESNVIKPITQQIFETRLQLSRLLAETGEEENMKLSAELIDHLHGNIKNLDRNRFQVDMNLRYVEKFKEREIWNNLNADDVHQIVEYLSALPAPDSSNEVTRRFDLMMLKLQLAKLLEMRSVVNYQERLTGIAIELGKKYTIPEVLQAKPIIENLKNPEFYEKLSQKILDQIREEIRELVKYLETASRQIVYTDLIDSELTIIDDKREPYKTRDNQMYKKRVERYIRDHKHQLTISKLSSNIPITKEELKVLEGILFDEDKRGSKVDFNNEYGDEPLGKFVRSILGLNIAAAEKAFADFLQAGNLQADQMTFITNIITFLTKNGVIDKSMLFEPPFTDVNDQGLLGVFDDADAFKIISIIDEINDNAQVG